MYLLFYRSMFVVILRGERDLFYMLTWYANSFRHGYRYAHSGHYTPGANTGTPLNFLSLIFSRLPSLGVHRGPVMLNFLSRTVCPEVADNFSGPTEPQRYVQRSQSVPPSAVSTNAIAK